MTYQYFIDPDELEDVKKQHSWIAEYYKNLIDSKIEKVMLGIVNDEPTIAIPILSIRLNDNSLYTCEILCANDLSSPGVIAGLPIIK